MKVKNKKEKVFRVRLTEDQEKRLKSIAKARKASCSSVVRSLISRPQGRLKLND
jgi:predicted transcriptional regulator